MTDLPDTPGAAIVIGAGGGIGAAMRRLLEARGEFAPVIGFGRGLPDRLDLLDEGSIAAAAGAVAGLAAPPRLILDATGFLHGGGFAPEKSWRQIDPAHMAHAFAINAIGPALLMKHFLPLLPREGRSVFATLSAKVGSIGDNALGGWYSYRAAKAALNQLVRTAAIELARRNPAALCVALHPGTVDTGLSAPFARIGLDIQTPDQAAARLLSVIETLPPSASGGFFSQHGEPIAW
jgi:NAD(P)-dependent dehydrogenase (short-subunit alcohol dehydrogenase family)